MRECMTETMYEKLGISKEVYEFGQTIEAGLKERFSQMDEVAEYNQSVRGVSTTPAGMATTIWEETHWSRYTPVHSIQKRHWFVRRLPVERTPLPLPLQQTYVRETNCSRRWENHMIRLRK